MLTNDELKKLADNIKSAIDRKELDFFLIITDQVTGLYCVTGTLCPICTMKNLLDFIVENQVGHKELEFQEKETKH